MLPPLNQATDARVASDVVPTSGPPREALRRPTATASSSTYSSSSRSDSISSASPRRGSSMAKPPPATPTTSYYPSPRRSTFFKPTPPPPTTFSTATVIPQPLAPGAATAVESISRIPREFFVIETNAVLPQTQYPLTQYQSTFIGTGTWETIVFPSLTPHTRQQVLYLKKTLDKLRQQATTASARTTTRPSTGEQNSRLVESSIDYTETEWALHSLCFHELARQIKFICKEQSELLFEIQEVYDASMARLLALARSSHRESEQKQNMIDELVVENDQRRQEQQGHEPHPEATHHTIVATPSSTSQPCSCGGRQHRRRTRRPHRSAGSEDDGDDDDDRSTGDESGSSSEEDDEEAKAWRAFKRRRRQLRLRGLTTADRDDDDPGSEDGSGGGGSRQDRTKHQRDSVVEENTAAARVQQAFQKYQARKEEHRLVHRKEKMLAALHIQRSYRGYKQRQLALHRRAVMQTIFKRRQQVAAVELLQMNVRAYLVKMRRDIQHGKAAQKSMLEAQRAALQNASAQLERQTSSRLPSELEGAAAEAATDSIANDRFTHLLNRMSELATAFSCLHSRRRYIKPTTGRAAHSVSELQENQAKRDEAMDGGSTVEQPAAADANGQAIEPQIESASIVEDIHCSNAEHGGDGAGSRDLPVAGDDDNVVSGDDRALLDITIHQAEDLLQSLRSAISELKQSQSGEDGDTLTKTTSTTTLSSSAIDALNATRDFDGDDVLGAGSFLFMDDESDSAHRCQRRSRLSGQDSSVSLLGTAVRGRHGTHGVDGGEEEDPSDPFFGANDNDDDDTHLDDVLWQTSVYVTRSAEQLEEEATARQMLTRELLASRDQQKRHAWLKQFIVDIYETIVGRLNDLPAQRRHKLIQIHASLVLSFSDGQRFLGRRRQHGASGSEYEPVSAFVGRLEISELIRDHFHCQVGLKHLVDASVERLVRDLREFMGIDPDIQRFHDFLTHVRSLDELVFFCLCRLLAQGKTTQSRQPLFHQQSMREVVDASHGIQIARVLFHASGSDADMLKTDAFIIEPSNEIYQRHLPSSGLQQLETILQNYATPVDDLSPDQPPLQASFVRASNVNQFHAKEYNASVARSPIVRPREPTAGLFTYSNSSTSSISSGGTTWVFFDEVVGLLRRYRSVMRHFHAFIHWTHDLFHEAFRQQMQQQVVGAPSTLAAAASGSSSTPLLEEASFVATLVPFSLGAGERELRNVFHNALKQRYLQRLMPVRVFVSVVLVLLRNGLLSVTSYQPLQHKESVEEPERVPKPPTVAVYRHQQEEKQWMQLALRWRGQEKHFEETVERIYAGAPQAQQDQEKDDDNNDGDGDGDASSCSTNTSNASIQAQATQLLQLRNELYELFISRSGRESLQRAQFLYESLADSMRTHNASDHSALVEDDGHEQDKRPNESNGTHENSTSPTATSAAIGAPWFTDGGDGDGDTPVY